jgi:hypothetical protein
LDFLHGNLSFLIFEISKFFILGVKKASISFCGAEKYTMRKILVITERIERRVKKSEIPIGN